MYEILLFRNPLAAYFTHWIFALVDSLLALVMRWRKYVPEDVFELPFEDPRLDCRGAQFPAGIG